MVTDHSVTSLQRYLDEVGRHPLLSPSEETRLGRLAAAGSEQARRRLVESNLRLVVSIARRYRGVGLDFLDLIQEGNLGLIAASERFDWRRNVRFSTCAGVCIRHAIMRALSAKSRLVRLPERVAEASARVRRAEAMLCARLGRQPSIEEVAREAGVDREAIVELRRAELAPLSFEDPVDEDLTVADVLRGEIASALRLSRERVRRVQNRALAQIAMKAAVHRGRLAA